VALDDRRAATHAARRGARGEDVGNAGAACSTRAAAGAPAACSARRGIDGTASTARGAHRGAKPPRSNVRPLHRRDGRAREQGGLRSRGRRAGGPPQRDLGDARRGERAQRQRRVSRPGRERAAARALRLSDVDRTQGSREAGDVPPREAAPRCRPRGCARRGAALGRARGQARSHGGRRHAGLRLRASARDRVGGLARSALTNPRAGPPYPNVTSAYTSPSTR